MKISKRASVRIASRKAQPFNVEPDTSEVLFFDTETTSGDFSQTLRVGAWGMKNRTRNLCRGFGLFVADDLPAAERATVVAYARGFGTRVDHVIARQVEIRAAEITRADAAEAPAKRKAPDVLDREIAEAGKAIERGFDGMRRWVKANGGLPVWGRATFGEMLLDAMRGTLPWGDGMQPDGPCAVVGLNLRFDFGSIAAPWPEPGPDTGGARVMAWGRHDKATDEKGFTYHLCQCAERTIHTPDRVKFGNLSGVVRRASCPRHPAIVSRNMGGRKEQYGLSDGALSGPILDVSVLGRALLGPGDASLRGLGDRMAASILKRKDETGHGDALTFDYLDYLLVDIMATANLFDLLIDRYEEHATSTPITAIFSEASVGKAHLKDFGIPGDFYTRSYAPLDNGEPIDRRVMFDAAQQSYQGARSEVMMRLTPAPIIHCDFKSQYPSVNAIMGLQSLLTGSRFGVTRGLTAIERARDVLSLADHAWLNDRENWKRLRLIVKVRIGGCFLPTKYPDDTLSARKIYGMTYLDKRDDTEAWYPLSDIVASKLLTDDAFTPDILDAFEISTVESVDTSARPVFGSPIDLTRDDFFVSIIDRRTMVKAEMDAHLRGSAEWLKRENIQNNLKLIANATSYGALAETRMSGIEGEVMGTYYAPFIASHITGGSRLLLALAQSLASNLGNAKLGMPIRHAMCDTDSMSFIHPEGVSYEAFDAVVTEITDYFSRLSPYEKDKALFARELPKAKDTKTRAYFFGVSCKRYCMFTYEDDGSVKLRKVSSHGLGHIRTDNDPNDASKGDLFGDAEYEAEADDLGAIPDPHRLDNWRPDQGRMWVRAIERALGRRAARPGEARIAGFPREGWNEGIARTPVNVSTPSKALEYAALGVRPGSFFMTMPSVGKSKLRICMPMSRHTREIMDGPLADKSTGHILSAEQVRSLTTPVWAGLRDYFVNPERKARSKSGRTGTQQEPGYLSYHTRRFDGIQAVNRRGQNMDQVSLFDE